MGARPPGGDRRRRPAVHGLRLPERDHRPVRVRPGGRGLGQHAGLDHAAPVRQPRAARAVPEAARRRRRVPVGRAHRARGGRQRPDADADDAPTSTATSGSSTGTSGSRRARHGPRSRRASPRPSPTPRSTCSSARSSSRPTRPATSSSGPCRRWATSAASTARSSTTTCACPSRTCSATAARASSSAQKRLGPGRIFHCMRWLGQAQRAFELMCDRALTRYAHGSMLAEKGAIQTMIAESAAEIQGARLDDARRRPGHGLRAPRRASRSASSSSTAPRCSTT